jgi:hypothetical protein
MRKIRTPKIRTPKIRTPRIGTPRLQAPRIQTPRIQTPQFLNHLYRDLRDRRLLFPAVALLVALIAVPVAFSSSSATTTPPPAAPVESGSGPVATEPAVLAEELGVTKYQERLERLQSKNPFKRQYTDAPSTTQPEASSSPEASTTSTTSSSVATEPSASTSTAPDATTTSSSSPASSTSPSAPPEPTLFAFQADVGIGRPGDVTRRKHVELGKFLPSEAKSMVAFAGATENMKRALFLVSADVSSVDGDGRCVPGPNNCSLLRLKVGDEAKLAYAPEGDRTYRLRLHGVELAPIDPKTSGKRGKRDRRNKRDSVFALAARG